MTMGGPHFCHNSGFVQWTLNIFHLAWNMNFIFLVVAESGSCKDHDHQGFSIFQTHMLDFEFSSFQQDVKSCVKKKAPILTHPHQGYPWWVFSALLLHLIFWRMTDIEEFWCSLISYYNDISFYFCKHVIGTWNTHCATFTELFGIFNCTFFINWTPANKVWE